MGLWREPPGRGERYNSGESVLKKEIPSQTHLSIKTHLLSPVTLFVASLVGFSTIQAQTLSDNKAIVLRSEAELWSKGNLALADELYSP
jgi:hypothetical protein